MSSFNKAIILGGGISGKLAARVISDHFKEVLILERDQEPQGPTARKGAKQGEHLHALLFAGQYGLEEIFPGITEKFHSSGAVKINSTKDLAWFHHGVWKLRFDGNYTTTLQSRPHLEWHIEQYIKDISNVSIYYNQVVKNYLYHVDENRVYGVEVKNDDHSSTTYTADLIVDASGARSFTTSWLKEMGITIPNKKLTIGLNYFSKYYHLPESTSRDWKIKMLYPNPPHEKIGGTISQVEGERYIVTIMSYQKDLQEKEVITKENGFEELAKKLPKLDIYNEIKAGIPLSKTANYRVPEMIWRRVDQVKQLPKGLLMIGDTVCRVDPVFGQGMSIAILEALALQQLLKKNYSPQQTVTLFHKKIPQIISPIWNMVSTEDFRYPHISGKMPFGLSIQQWYSKTIFLLSAKDKNIYQSFVDVMNLTQPVTLLMRLPILKKVITHFFK